MVTTGGLLATLVKVAYNNDPKELPLERTNAGALQDISCGHLDGARYFYPALDIYQEKHHLYRQRSTNSNFYIFHHTVTTM